MSGSAKISREVVEKAPAPSLCVSHSQAYVGRGVARVEKRIVTRESDFDNELYERFSDDNGRTWGAWKDIYKATYAARGTAELLWPSPSAGTWNPVHGHAVALNMQRIFPEGHEEGYRLFWKEGRRGFYDHTFLWVSEDSLHWTPQLVRYENGEEFHADDWCEKGYLENNGAYAGCNLEVLPNGDVLFAVSARMTSCCRILGVDVRDAFPSCPQIMGGLIVFRGSWDRARGLYSLVPSRPAVISDLESSRGIDEPVVLPLASGLVAVVFRGSNMMSKEQGTRIRKGTPSYKWFLFSEDGGRTFTKPVPWHWDDGEVLYSPASISGWLRSSRNGRGYWFGNATGPEAYANAPRYPLIMAEVEEETGFLVKGSRTIVEDRDPATESEKLQLSNFTLLDDRETGRIELSMTKLGANRDDFWRSDAYRYCIEVS